MTLLEASIKDLLQSEPNPKNMKKIFEANATRRRQWKLPQEYNKNPC
jgi:hypothetical protein